MLKKYCSSVVLSILLASTAMGAEVVNLSWSTTGDLPAGKRQMALASTLNYVYSIGGRTGTDNSGDEVYLGTVANGGEITWTAAGTMPQQVTASGAAVVGTRLFVWGGWTDGFPTVNTCYYADINVSDGSLGSWVTSAVTIPDVDGATFGDAFHTSNAAFNDTLYIVNGENNNGTKQDVALYSVVTGGDFGAWQTTTAPGEATWFHGMGFYDGDSQDYIYRFGGGPGTFASASPVTLVAPLNGDGSIGAWAATGDMPEGRVEAGYTSDPESGYLFCIGGVTPDSGTAGTDTVFVGKVNDADGTVTWTTHSSVIPAVRMRNRAVVYQDGNGDKYIAVVGGRLSDADPAETTVYYSALEIIQQTDASSFELYQ